MFVQWWDNEVVFERYLSSKRVVLMCMLVYREVLWCNDAVRTMPLLDDCQFMWVVWCEGKHVHIWGWWSSLISIVWWCGTYIIRLEVLKLRKLLTLPSHMGRYSSHPPSGPLNIVPHHLKNGVISQNHSHINIQRLLKLRTIHSQSRGRGGMGKITMGHRGLQHIDPPTCRSLSFFPLSPSSWATRWCGAQLLPLLRFLGCWTWRLSER